MLPAIITEHEAEIDELCRKFHVRRLEVFGSAATGEWDPANSDLDFLVSFRLDGQWGERRLLEQAFEELFACRIDLVRERKFENPYFRQSVEESRTHLWGDRRRSRPRNGARVSDNRALKYLWDIRREIGYLENTIAGLNLETVLNNISLLRSMQAHLMVIGEALNRLSDVDADLFQRITDASGYIGQRNILIHQYDDVDWSDVWHSVQVEIPLLLEEVNALIDELDPQAETD